MSFLFPPPPPMPVRGSSLVTLAFEDSGQAESCRGFGVLWRAQCRAQSHLSDSLLSHCDCPGRPFSGLSTPSNSRQHVLGIPGCPAQYGGLSHVTLRGHHGARHCSDETRVSEERPDLTTCGADFPLTRPECPGAQGHRPALRTRRSRTST